MPRPTPATLTDPTGHNAIVEDGVYIREAGLYRAKDRHNDRTRYRTASRGGRTTGAVTSRWRARRLAAEVDSKWSRTRPLGSASMTWRHSYSAVIADRDSHLTWSDMRADLAEHDRNHVGPVEPDLGRLAVAGLVVAGGIALCVADCAALAAGAVAGGSALLAGQGLTTAATLACIEACGAAIVTGGVVCEVSLACAPGSTAAWGGGGGGGAAAEGAAADDVVRGTNVPGFVTTRPSGFRIAAERQAWETAAEGPLGGRICPTCGVEVTVPPAQPGMPRDWHMSHNPSWSTREFPADVTRSQVLDDYNQGVSLECPTCNVNGGNNDLRFGGG